MPGLRVVRPAERMKRLVAFGCWSALALPAGSARQRHLRGRPGHVAARRAADAPNGARPSARAGLADAARRAGAAAPTPQLLDTLAAGRAPPTASRGRCSPRSTRSSRTSGATWARARRARSAGCSSCPRPGCGGASTRTATASPTRGTPATRSTRRRATSPPRAAATDISGGGLLVQPRRSGTWTRCCSSRSSTLGSGGWSDLRPASPRSRSTSSSPGSTRARGRR